MKWNFKSTPFVLILTLLLLMLSCGTKEKSFRSLDTTNAFLHDISNQTYDLTYIEGLGISFEIPKHSAVSHRIIEYDGINQHDIYIDEMDKPKAEIFIAPMECNLFKNESDFRHSVKMFVEKIAKDAVTNSEAELFSPESYALRRVPKTANEKLFGYYFDMRRKYHQERRERLEIIADELNEGKCLKIKANVESSDQIHPETLLGKTLRSVQESIRFTN